MKKIKLDEDHFNQCVEKVKFIIGINYHYNRLRIGYDYCDYIFVLKEVYLKSMKSFKSNKKASLDTYIISSMKNSLIDLWRMSSRQKRPIIYPLCSKPQHLNFLQEAVIDNRTPELYFELNNES